MAGGVGFFKKTSPIVPCEDERDTKDGICKMEQNGAGVRMFNQPGFEAPYTAPYCGADTGCVRGNGGYHDGINAGEAATSGVSLVDMVNTLFINIFAAVATGGAVVSSQYLGQRRRDRACQSANQLILITACISLIIMVLCILFRRGVLHLLYGGVAGDVMANALVYLTISALSYPFLAVYNSCAALFRSMGNSKISMQASIIMNIINVIGDSLFIFVFHWGVAGAAAASLISRMTACFILLFRLKNKNLDIFIGGKWNLNFRMVKQILGIGIPNGIENSIFQLGRVLVVGIIAMFGTTQIAANAIANIWTGWAYCPGRP